MTGVPRKRDSPQGNVEFNNPDAELKYQRREEAVWPLPGTQYTEFYLTPEKSLLPTPQPGNGSLSWKALGSLENAQAVQFITSPFDHETELLGM